MGVCLLYIIQHRLQTDVHRDIIRDMSSLFDFSEMKGIHIDQHNQEQEQDKQYLYDQRVDRDYSPDWSLKILVAYSYFIQGVIFSLPETMTLVYSTLPSYNILSIFSAASIPFSIKFFLAPFIEKFTLIKYGKRKFWMIISQITVSSILMIASFFTHQKYQAFMGFLMVSSIFFVALQDISLDALAIKQLRIPHLVGALQSIFQTIGAVMGSMVLLKLTSHQFAQNFDLKEPISEPSTILRCVAIALLLPTAIVHIFYRQRKLKSEKKINKKTFWQIVLFYRIFLNIRSRYCLTCIMFVLYLQGFNYFIAGYQYELIHSGFKRNTLNTITNVNVLPISVITYFISQRLNSISPYRVIIVYMVLRWSIYMLVYLIFPTQIVSVGCVVFIFQTLDNFKFLIISVIVNQFPVSGISGMMITMLVSSSNFGSFKAFALLMTGKFGWKTVAGIGMLVQLVIIALYSQLYKYVQGSNTQQVMKVADEQSQLSDTDQYDEDEQRRHISLALQPSVFSAVSYYESKNSQTLVKQQSAQKQGQT